MDSQSACQQYITYLLSSWYPSRVKLQVYPAWRSSQLSFLEKQRSKRSSYETTLPGWTLCSGENMWTHYKQLHRTYFLKNLRVKMTKYEKYWNTPRNEDFLASECEEFTTPLVPVEEDVNSMSTFSGHILGIQTATKSLLCVGCNNKSIEPTGNKAICRSCGVTQSTKACATSWSIRLHLKPDDSSRNLRLVLENRMVEQLICMISATVYYQKFLRKS